MAVALEINKNKKHTVSLQFHEAGTFTQKITSSWRWKSNKKW